METKEKKPIRLTKSQQFRAKLTQIALVAQDRFENGRPLRPFEDAFQRAMEAKLEEDPRFAWRAA